MVEALKRMAGDPRPEKLLGAINAAPFGFGGAAPSCRFDKNQSSDQAFITTMQADGSFKPLVPLVKTVGQ